MTDRQFKINVIKSIFLFNMLLLFDDDDDDDEKKLDGVTKSMNS
jgi:hypothetical protein